MRSFCVIKWSKNLGEGILHSLFKKEDQEETFQKREKIISRNAQLCDVSPKGKFGRRAA